jgi:tetratricopeptide (TPR) repeat protein
LYQKIDDLKGQADTLIDIAFFRQARGDFAISEQLLTQSLELWNRLADKQGELKVSYYLGWIYYNRGNFNKAQEMFNYGLELAIDLGNKQNLTGTNGGLGSTLIALGDLKKAEEHFQKQLYFGNLINDEQAQPTALINLAITDILNGKYDQARKHIEESERIVRKSGDTWTLGTVLTVNGWIEVSEGGNYKNAIKNLKEAIPILEKNQNNSWLSIARACYSASRAYDGELKPEVALREIGETIEFCRSKGRIFHLVEEYRIKCELAAHFDMKKEAIQACIAGNNLAANYEMKLYQDIFTKMRKIL